MNNPFEYLLFQAKRNPQLPAVYYGNGLFTFEQLYVLSKQLALTFRKQGMLPEQIVSIQIQNPVLHAAVTLALFHEAVLACSMQNHASLPEEIQAHFSH